MSSSEGEDDDDEPESNVVERPDRPGVLPADDMIAACRAEIVPAGANGSSSSVMSLAGPKIGWLSDITTAAEDIAVTLGPVASSSVRRRG